MYQMSLEEIIPRIEQESGLSSERIGKMIDDKVKELNGMVSREGAAHIIANQLGIRLLKTSERKELQLKNLLPGLRNVSVYGRVIRIFDPIEWEKEDRSGKVGSVLISDGTGTTRIVFWDKRVDMIGKDINKGAIIRVRSAYVKKGNYGPEVHMRDKSELEINPEGLEAPALPELKTFSERVNIADIEEGSMVSIRAAVVDFIPRDPFFKVCPECSKKVTEQDNKFFCEAHGEVEPQTNMVINLVFDDGTGNIRGVLFGKRAEQVLGVEISEIVREAEKTSPADALKKYASKILGKEFVVSGRARINSFSNYLEISASTVSPTEPVAEAKKIIKDIEEETFNP